VCDSSCADHDVAHDNLNAGITTTRQHNRFAILDDQFGEHWQGRHALGHHQVPFAYLLAPIVNLPTCRAVLARNIGYNHPGHHTFHRDPRPLCLRAPTTTARPLDHLKPGNHNIP